jgi:hypothetical protein
MTRFGLVLNPHLSQCRRRCGRWGRLEVAKDKQYTPKDPAPLMRAVIVWLFIYLAAQVLYGAASLFELQTYSMMSPDAASDSAPPDVELGVGAVEILEGLVSLISGILVLKWIYRSSRNAHVLARGLEISPPWAVGWYFIPFANLWKPFQAVREIWQVSKSPVGWRRVAVPALLRWWWGLWLISNACGNLSARLAMTEHTISGQTISDYFGLAEAVADAALAIVLIAIVRRITKMQVTALAAREEAPPETAPAEPAFVTALPVKGAYRPS